MSSNCRNPHFVLLPLLVVLCFRSLAGVYAMNDVEHLQIEGAHLIDTDQRNYALSTPGLQQLAGWKTVSVNGNQVVFLSSTCQESVKSLGSLTQAEQALLKEAKEELYQVEWIGDQDQDAPGEPGEPGKRLTRSGSSRYSTDGHLQWTLFANNFQPVSIERNGVTITKLGDQDLAIGRPDFPDRIAMIFLHDDLATFVRRDGQVRMRPVNCLSPIEAQLVEEARDQADQVDQLKGLNLDQQQQQNLQRLILNVLDGDKSVSELLKKKT